MEFLLTLLIVEIGLFFITLMLNDRDIMSPSVMMCMVFLLSTAIALCNVKNWSIDYDVRSFMLISLGIACFIFGDVSIYKINSKSKSVDLQLSNQGKISPIRINIWKTLFFIIFNLIIFYLYRKEILRIVATNSYFDNKNISYAYRMIVSHSDTLLPEQNMKGYVSQLSKIVIITGFIYMFIFINNFFVCKEKLTKNLLYLVPPAILVYMTLYSGVRTNVLRLATFSIVVGYILMQTKLGWSVKASGKFVKILFLIGSVGVVLFGFSQSLLGRYGSVNVFEVISNYVGAPIQHFNQYIQNPPAPNEVFGQETLTSIWNSLNKFGFTTKQYSSMEEYRYLNSKNFGNIYTFFRRLIQDYGVFGMCVMSSIIGMFFSYIYNVLLKNRNVNYRWYITLIEYGYLYYIVVLSSIDQIIQDYVGLGTIIMIVFLHIIFRFMLSVNENKGIRSKSL